LTRLPLTHRGPPCGGPRFRFVSRFTVTADRGATDQGRGLSRRRGTHERSSPERPGRFEPLSGRDPPRHAMKLRSPMILARAPASPPLGRLVSARGRERPRRVGPYDPTGRARSSARDLRALAGVRRAGPAWSLGAGEEHGAQRFTHQRRPQGGDLRPSGDLACRAALARGAGGLDGPLHAGEWNA